MLLIYLTRSLHVLHCPSEYQQRNHGESIEEPHSKAKEVNQTGNVSRNDEHYGHNALMSGKTKQQLYVIIVFRNIRQQFDCGNVKNSVKVWIIVGKLIFYQY